MARNAKGQIVHRYTDRKVVCIGCGKITIWDDCICAECDTTVPEYIEPIHVDRFLIMRKKKYGKDEM